MRDHVTEFAAFALVGAVNAALSYTAFLLLLGVLHYLTAFTIAFVIGIATSYVLNTRFVFKRQHEVRTMLRFPLIYVVQYVYGSIALSLLVGIFTVSKPLAMLLVMASSAVLTFVLMKHLFRASSLRNDS
jgi:putative flippase GtrA